MENKLNELYNDFLVKRDLNGNIISIESINSYPIDCDSIKILGDAIEKYSNKIIKLKLRISVDRGYIHSTLIANELNEHGINLFNAIIKCINIEIFELCFLQFPHNLLKYYFNYIIMNDNVIFKSLYSFSFDINEYLLLFLKDYFDENNDNQDDEIQIYNNNENDKFKHLNIFSTFLLRHKLYLNDIKIKVHLSPNIVMYSISNHSTETLPILRSILRTLIWRLLGSIYFSEIDIKSFYFYCRYNLNMTKFIPLIEHIITGNCKNRLSSFSLNCSHLQSNQIKKLLNILIKDCNKYKLNSFTLNGLDTFPSFSNNANKSLQNFLNYFINLNELNLNIAQFQLYQYNNFIKTLKTHYNIKQLFIGDCCIPSIKSCGYGIYDEINIFNIFSELINNSIKNNISLISIDIQKLDVVAQFIMKCSIIIDSIYKLYINMQSQINIIYNILSSNIYNYPQDIIHILIQYLFNYNDKLLISISGSPKLSKCKSNIIQYIKQQKQEQDIIINIKKTVILGRPICLKVNGTLLVNTHNPNIHDDNDERVLFKYNNL